ncbi:MAG: gluconate permease [Planctomycetaceae bacterium]|nr:gluconate permease [Planctomycetaceae bacterium]
MTIPPLMILAIGVLIVLGMIIVLRINAFIALITAAIAVSLMAPGETAEKMSRVAVAFGAACGNIGIVIALAAVIGKAMMDSGAADRVVRAFLNALGEKRASLALMGSGYVLSVPVFFDTVFYLLVPLARSLYRKTGKNFLLYVCAIAAGGAVTHTLVPPTPGPLTMAAQLKIDVGMMILVGGMVAIPTSLSGLLFAAFVNRRMDIPMRQIGTEPEPEPLEDHQLPGLLVSLLPVILPVLMISAHTIASTLANMEGEAGGTWTDASQYTAIFGNANLALLVSAVIAVATYWNQRQPTLTEMGHSVEVALMSGGLIILITAGGGAFGAMLKAAEIGDAIKNLFPTEAGLGMTLLFLGFGLASLLKVAQGSSTVAMITGTAMLAGMLPEGASSEVAAQLGYHPVYLATAVGAGSLVGSWMNDSGFWIFARMSGLTELEALKTWTPLLAIMGMVTMACTLLLANVLPLI